jgi:hypothetical protein
MNTEFFCGEVGCAALGMAFIAAILVLVVIGWVYEMWRRRMNRYLEEMERDIQRTRHLEESDERDRVPSDEDGKAAASRHSLTYTTYDG